MPIPIDADEPKIGSPQDQVFSGTISSCFFKFFREPITISGDDNFFSISRALAAIMFVPPTKPNPQEWACVVGEPVAVNQMPRGDNLAINAAVPRGQSPTGSRRAPPLPGDIHAPNFKDPVDQRLHLGVKRPPVKRNPLQSRLSRGVLSSLRGCFQAVPSNFSQDELSHWTHALAVAVPPVWMQVHSPH